MVAIIALFFPRFVTFCLWAFSTWFVGVFQTALWPILGFFFMPYTLLWYSAVIQWYGGVWGNFQLIILVVAVLADLSSSGSAASSRD